MGGRAALGTCCKDFFWLLEALAAGQVLILGYFQPLSIPLCCVCPSSCTYPAPCIVTLPLMPPSLDLLLSRSRPPSLYLAVNTLFPQTHWDKGFSHTPCTGGCSPTGPQEAAVPLTHTPTETEHTHLKEQRPFPGKRLPTKFLTTITHPPEPGQQFQLPIS